MAREFPAFHCDPESMTLVDEAVADFLGAYIKQNNEQMQAIKDTFASSTAAPLPHMHVRAVQNDLIDLADTPGAKKRKLGEEVRIKENIENKSCLTISVDPKTVSKSYLDPKNSPLGP